MVDQYFLGRNCHLCSHEPAHCLSCSASMSGFYTEKPASMAQSDARQSGDQDVVGSMPVGVWQHSFM